MFRKWLFWAFLIAILVHIKADTKVLQKFEIFDGDSIRQETFSLKNENTPEEELIIEGTHKQQIYPQDNGGFVYRIETIYVADKDGYRVKYKLVREPSISVVAALNPMTLKATAG
ncbi:uncharacterized protein ACRADG_001095 [Cochliomyia hominivorax]